MKFYEKHFIVNISNLEKKREKIMLMRLEEKHNIKRLEEFAPLHREMNDILTECRLLGHAAWLNLFQTVHY